MNLSKLKEVTKGKTRTTGVSPFMELELSKVYPNPDQPRKQFNDDEINELALAIQQDGLLQPIVVVKKDDGYMIVSGERRYKAHIRAELETIKSHIIDVDESKVLELALIENIQREDLTDFEVAVHIGKLWSSGNYSSKGVLAVALGKSPSFVSKAFSCLKIDDAIILDIQEAKHNIPISILDEISRVKDKEIQKDVYKMYLNKEITRDGIAAHKNAESDKGFAKRMEKRKHILSSEVYTGEQFFKYFIQGMKNRIQDDKRYKITIEEV